MTRKTAARLTLLIFVVATATLTGLYALRHLVISPWLTGIIESQAKTAAGLDLSIGAIRGNFFSTLVFRDINLRCPGPAEDSGNSLTLAEASCSFRLLDLFHSPFRFARNITVDLQGLHGVLAPESLPSCLPVKAQPAGDTEEAGLPLPGSLTLADSSLTLLLKDKRLLLSGFAANLQSTGTSPADIAVRGSLRAGEVLLETADRKLEAVSLATAFSWEGEELTIRDLAAADTILVERAVLHQDRGADNELLFTGDMKILGSNLTATAEISDQAIDAHLTAEDLDLDKITGLPLAPFDSFSATGHGSSTLSLYFPAGDPAGFTAELALHLRDPGLSGRRLDTLDLVARLNPSVLLIEQLDLTGGANTFSFTKAAVPREELSGAELYAILARLEGTFSGRFQDVPGLLAKADLDLPRQVEPVIASHDLKFRGKLGEGRLLLSEASLTTQSGRVGLKNGSLTLPPTAESLASSSIQADLAVSVPRVEEITSLFALPEVGGALSGTVKISGFLADPSASLDLKGGIDYAGLRFTDVELLARLDSSRVEVRRLLVRQGPDHLQLTGVYDSTAGRLEDVAVTAEVARLATYDNFLLLPWPAAGAFQATARLNGPLPVPDMTVDLSGRDVIINDFTLPSVSLHLENSDNILHRYELTLTTAGFRLDAGGRGSHDLKKKNVSLLVNRFSLSNKDLTLALRRDTELTFSETGGLTIAPFVLEGSCGSLEAGGSISADRVMDLSLSTENLCGQGWLDLLLADLSLTGADLNLALTGSPDAPRLAVDGTVKRLGAADLPVALSGSFNLTASPDGIEVKSLTWRSGDGSEITAHGHLPVNPFFAPHFSAGEIRLQAGLHLPDIKLAAPFVPEEYRGTGSATGRLEMTGTWDEPAGHLNLSAKNITMPVLESFFIPGPLDLNLEALLDKRKLTIHSLEAGSPRLIMSASGTWQPLPSPRDLLLSPGKSLAGMISGSTRLKATDLGWLAAHIEGFRRVSGSMVADLTLSGDITDPDITGTMTLTEGEMRFETDIPPIKALTLETSIANRVIILKRLSGEMGSAPLQGDGRIILSSPGPEFDLHLTGQQLLFYRQEGIKVRADADLTFSGPLDKSRLAGDIVLTDGRFSRNFDFLGFLRGSPQPRSRSSLLFSFPDPPLKDMVLQVGISSRTPFQIRNNVARASLRPQLTLKGSGQLPYLVGEIYLDQGRLSLPSGHLDFENGLIRFPENNPDTILLELPARSRIAGYDITVQVQGSAVEPVVSLSSNPPLAEDELLYLVLTGTLPTGRGTALFEGQRKNMKVAVYLARNVLSQWFGGGEGGTESELLDRFELEVGRGITHKGDETIEAQFLLKEDFLDQRNTLYITSEKDVYDEFNLGVKIVFQFK